MGHQGRKSLRKAGTLRKNPAKSPLWLGNAAKWPFVWKSQPKESAPRLPSGIRTAPRADADSVRIPTLPRADAAYRTDTDASTGGRGVWSVRGRKDLRGALEGQEPRRHTTEAQKDGGVWNGEWFIPQGQRHRWAECRAQRTA